MAEVFTLAPPSATPPNRSGVKAKSQVYIRGVAVYLWFIYLWYIYLFIYLSIYLWYICLDLFIKMYCIHVQ